MTEPQHSNIEVNRVYRRAEYATRPEPWSSPLPSLEIIGEGCINIYVSNLPRQLGCELYKPPINDNKIDIMDKMTLLKDKSGSPITLKEGIHDSCLCTVWIAFCWDETSSVEPPIIRDACLIDWELDTRRQLPQC